MRIQQIKEFVDEACTASASRYAAKEISSMVTLPSRRGTSAGAAREST
ncbi:hypothetical protein [Nonomuraea sp. NPDC049158]